MKIIGITGRICSGKSHLVNAMVDLYGDLDYGVKVLSLDEMASDILDTKACRMHLRGVHQVSGEAELIEAIRSGALDLNELAYLVWTNGLYHLLNQKIEDCRVDDDVDILLIECHNVVYWKIHELCDITICALVSDSVSRERYLDRDEDPDMILFDRIKDAQDKTILTPAEQMQHITATYDSLSMNGYTFCHENKKLLYMIDDSNIEATVRHEFPAGSVVFSGTFDPFTCGHADIVKTAQLGFAHVVIVVCENSAKDSSVMGLSERIKCIKDCYELSDKITVVGLGGHDTLVGFMVDHHLRLSVRGIRNEDDYKYEMNLRALNKVIGGPDVIHHFYIQADADFVGISSSAVRALARVGSWSMKELRYMLPSKIAAAYLELA